MKPVVRISLWLLLIGAGQAWSGEPDPQAIRPPVLDLSLPRETYPEPVSGFEYQATSQPAAGQPELGGGQAARPSGRWRADLPYGAGFEARQGVSGRGGGRGRRH